MKLEIRNKIIKLVKEKGVLIKISGGALASKNGVPYSEKNIDHIVNEICAIYNELETPKVAVVVGGGNIWRGSFGKRFGIKGAASDEIGMLATITNAVLISKKLAQSLGGNKVKTMLTKTGDPAETYSREAAISELNKGKIVVLGGGIGEPFVSTDFAAVNRAASLELGLVLMAKDGADGVYDREPSEKDAKRYETLSYDEFISKKLKVADNTAVLMALDNSVPLFFFDFSAKDIIESIMSGEVTGTLVSDLPTTYA